MGRRRLSQALMLLSATLLSACAGFPGPASIPATEADLLARIGPPARQWQDPDGQRQLSWPGGHFGRQSWMARISPDGRVLAFENVLDDAHFKRIKVGISDQESVLRLLGPPFKATDFERRNELAWEWRYTDVWTMPARYVVLFDRSTGKVRESWGAPEQKWERME